MTHSSKEDANSWEEPSFQSLVLHDHMADFLTRMRILAFGNHRQRSPDVSCDHRGASGMEFLKPDWPFTHSLSLPGPGADPASSHLRK